VGLLLARVLGASLGFFGFVGVFFWEGCSGRWVGVLRGRFGRLIGGFYCMLDV
jgi:hypothetical protein